jgi:hypothetical protein
VRAIIENPEVTTIDAKTMASGCELAAWYVAEALRLSDAYRQAPSLRNASRLLDWLQAKGKCETSIREIIQFGPSPVRKKAEAQAALAELEEHGWLMRQGDRRGARWILTAEATQ